MLLPEIVFAGFLEVPVISYEVEIEASLETWTTDPSLTKLTDNCV